MTWIKTVPADQGDEALRRCYEEVRRLYPPEYGESDDPDDDGVVAAHSLIPEAMRHAMSTYGVLLDPSLPLSRRQHEMIASVVSAQNRCFY